MYIQLTRDDVWLLLELLETEIARIEQQIGAEKLAAGEGEQTRRWQHLESLRHRLREYECDVLA